MKNLTTTTKRIENIKTIVLFAIIPAVIIAITVYSLCNPYVSL
jgi:hypothetical protein